MFTLLQNLLCCQFTVLCAGRSLAPDSVVRRFTNGRWINPTLQRRQRVQRVTGMGTLVEKWQPLEVGVSHAPLCTTLSL